MIYPINQTIESLLESFIDPETGEITKTEEEMQEAIAQAEIAFDEKVEALSCKYKNLKAEVAAIKAEKQKLGDRQKSDEKAMDRTGRFIAYLTEGKPYRNGAVNIGYRPSESTEVDPEFIEWAKENRPELIREKVTYEPDAAAIKDLLKAGEELPFARLNRKNNVQVK